MQTTADWDQHHDEALYDNDDASSLEEENHAQPLAADLDDAGLMSEGDHIKSLYDTIARQE